MRFTPKSSYGCELAAGLEVDGRLSREFDLPIDVHADMLKRIVIGAEPFSHDGIRHAPLRQLKEARP